MDQDGDGMLDAKEFIAAATIGTESVNEATSEALRELLGVYRRIFKNADLDYDGLLCARDATYAVFLVSDAVKALQAGGQPDFQYEDAQQVLIHADKDGDMMLNENEFKHFAYAGSRRLGFEDGFEDPDFTRFMDTVFNKADASGDRKLDVREFDFATYMCEHVTNWFEADMFKGAGMAMIAAEDWNHDGVLDANEVEAVLQRAAAQRDGGGAHARLMAYMDFAVDWLRGSQQRVDPGPAMAPDSVLQSMRRMLWEADENGDEVVDAREAKRLAMRLAMEM